MRNMKAAHLPSSVPASVPDQAPKVAPRPKVSIRERARRADLPKALSILKRAGKGNPPVAGDELKP